MPLVRSFGHFRPSARSRLRVPAETTRVYGSPHWAACVRRLVFSCPVASVLAALGFLFRLGHRLLGGAELEQPRSVPSSLSSTALTPCALARRVVRRVCSISYQRLVRILKPCPRPSIAPGSGLPDRPAAWPGSRARTSRRSSTLRSSSSSCLTSVPVAWRCCSCASRSRAIARAASPVICSAWRLASARISSISVRAFPGVSSIAESARLFLASSAVRVRHLHDPPGGLRGCPPRPACPCRDQPLPVGVHGGGVAAASWEDVCLQVAQALVLPVACEERSGRRSRDPRAAGTRRRAARSSAAAISTISSASNSLIRLPSQDRSAADTLAADQPSSSPTPAGRARRPGGRRPRCTRQAGRRSSGARAGWAFRGGDQ